MFYSFYSHCIVRRYVCVAANAAAAGVAAAVPATEPRHQRRQREEGGPARAHGRRPRRQEGRGARRGSCARGRLPSPYLYL